MPTKWQRNVSLEELTERFTSQQYYILGDKAGETFRKFAQVSIKLGNKHQAATAYNDAANCFRKTKIEGEILILSDPCAY